MIIKRWNGTEFTEEHPKTVAGQLYTNDGETSLFDQNTKLKVQYLPDRVFDNLKFMSIAVASKTNLYVYADDAIGYPADVYTDPEGEGYFNKQSAIGTYFVASENVTLQPNTVAQTGQYTQKEIIARFAYGVDGTYSQNDPVTVNAGDWFVIVSIQDIDGTLFVDFGVVNNTYELSTASTAGIMKLGSDATQTTSANAVTTTSSRTYAIQNNGSGQMVVNVPWVDTNTTYTASSGVTQDGTDFRLKLIDLTPKSVLPENITTTTGRTYATMLDTNGSVVVNVPWTDTTYGTATTTTKGLVEIAFNKLGTNPTLTETTTAGRYYGVSLNNNDQMVVNVPWTDTTYSAGNGIGLSGTTFSVDAGEGLTQLADGLRMTYPLYVQTTTPTTTVTGAIWYDIT